MRLPRLHITIGFRPDRRSQVLYCGESGEIAKQRLFEPDEKGEFAKRAIYHFPMASRVRCICEFDSLVPKKPKSKPVKE